jgi:NADH dehydrogenase FAD-containing subunit
VKVRPTLQLESHPSIWAVGDILDFPEGKRAIKANGQFSVLIPNLLAFLRDRKREVDEGVYPGSREYCSDEWSCTRFLLVPLAGLRHVDH